MSFPLLCVKICELHLCRFIRNTSGKTGGCKSFKIFSLRRLNFSSHQLKMTEIIDFVCYQDMSNGPALWVPSIRTSVIMTIS